MSEGCARDVPGLQGDRGELKKEASSRTRGNLRGAGQKAASSSVHLNRDSPRLGPKEQEQEALKNKSQPTRSGWKG